MENITRSWKSEIFRPYYFKLTIVLSSFISVVPYLNGKTEWFYRLLMIWGVLIAAYDIFTERKMTKSRYFWVFFVFCALGTLTFVSQRHLNFMKNIYRMGYMFMYLFVLFTCERDKSREQAKKELRTIAWLEILFSFVLVCINLIMLLFNLNGWYEYRNTWIPYGVYLGRLWGICNPNTSGAIGVIGVMFSLLFFEENRRNGTKKYQKFLIANMILQYVNISLGQSRTSKITYAGGVFLYLFFIRQDIREAVKLRGKKLGAWLGKRIVILLLIFTADLVILPVSMKTQQLVLSIFSEEKKPQDTLSEREDTIYEDMSTATNGRSVLWKAGLQVWKQHKLLGVGYLNIYEYGKEFVPERRLSNLENGNVHNAYLTVLVADGVLGALCMGIFLLALSWRLLSYLFVGKNLLIKGLCLQLATMLVSELAESRIFFGKSNFTFLFWICAGYFMYYLENWKPGMPEIEEKE